MRRFLLMMIVLPWLALPCFTGCVATYHDHDYAYYHAHPYYYGRNPHYYHDDAHVSVDVR